MIKSNQFVILSHTSSVFLVSMSCEKQQQSDFSKIRAKLSEFPGGNVSLAKDEHSGIAELVLDRPEKRNAMSGKMMVEFRDRVEELENWHEGKGVILRGNGCNFCSGADLKFAKASTARDGLEMSEWMRDALVRLQRLPLVSVCLVHGPCFGGGAELAVFYDYLIAADDVRFGFVQGKMGIVTAWGGGTRLVQKIGHKRALEVLLTSKVMDAEECVNVGLVDHVVSSRASLLKARDWLTARLSLPHQITRAFKTIVSNAHDYSYADALKIEGDIFAPFWGGSLNKQALDKNIKHS